MKTFYAHCIAIAFTSLFTIAHADSSHHPSKGAENIAGAEGTIEFKPVDHHPGTISWWKDSDGLDPGVAGCHIGTDEHGVSNGRHFGEACINGNLLVESNPGKEELHSHKDDIGHPDTFSCEAWCHGQGHEKGTCVAAAAPPCEASAMCKCE